VQLAQGQVVLFLAHSSVCNISCNSCTVLVLDQQSNHWAQH